jgi:hypothetical protein
MRFAMGPIRYAVLLTIALLTMPNLASSGEPRSDQFRLLGATPASVSARAASPLYHAQLAGGSGAAVGIAASPLASVVAGPISQELPTVRLFRGTFERD